MGDDLINLVKNSNCITNQVVKIWKTKLKMHELHGKYTFELFFKVIACQNSKNQNITIEVIIGIESF